MWRRRKRTLILLNMSSLQDSASSDCERRAWRMNIADSLEKERVARRNAKRSQQERKRKTHQDIMAFLRQQTQMLQAVVHMQVRQSWAHLLLQATENSYSRTFV